MKMMGIHAGNMTGIRYWDNMNPWVDFVVYIPGYDTQAVRRAAKKVRRTMDAFWNGESKFDTYGDAIVDAFKHTVALMIFHTPDDFETDEEFEDWEAGWECMIEETEVAVTLQD